MFGQGNQDAMDNLKVAQSGSQSKTIYFHTYKKVNRTRRHTVAECCPGWVHVPGMDGCQRGESRNGY
ncbi:unnamed protein product [Strongylus vulgaris]|uniref:EMI domain-containing protein n=1 Tax=Strongylus vulgaris TaxID=40348 RepID=A0A3P7J121_STRVU|nr:unnamed protein product [Strongylus vulgaris]